MIGNKVLITGMSGFIGGILRRHLEGSYQLRALNRSDVPGVECHRADIADLQAIQPAFEGIDSVIHLSAALGPDVPWEEYLQTNVIGTYNTFEAARLAGVKRFIYASTGNVTDSGHVVTDHERGYPYNLLIEGRYDEAPKPWPMITHESPLRPNTMYACTKIWGEALGRYYSDIHGLSVICLRIRAVPKENRPVFTRQWPMWCSHRDLAQLVQKSLEAPESLRYDIFYGISDNTWNFNDFQHAREVLGYEPQDNAEQHRS